MRQQLVKENKFSKYLIYASGEIILVVVGILLALQFNALSTNSKELVKEEWYLNNLLDDIFYQIQTLDYLTKDFEETIRISKSILKEYYNQNDYRKVDSLNEKLNLLLYSEYFPNTNNTYQEMISSGQLSLIKNKNLSLEVIDYYLYSKDNEVAFKNDIDNIYYPQIYPIINSLIQVDMQEIVVEDDEDYLLESKEENTLYINELLKDSKKQLALTNAIKLKILILSSHLQLIEETKKGAEVLNTLLETELENHDHN